MYFDKTSAQISNLVYRPGLVNIHDVAIQYMTTGANSNFPSEPCGCTRQKRKPTSIKEPINEYYTGT